MERVHEKIIQSSELTFVDSSSNMDEHNLRIFLFCTHSVVGALPLAIVITSDEQTETLITAFKMLKSILPQKSFFGNLYPEVFMTDNCYELRQSLEECFPSSKTLLCSFHMLQQVWRWLFDKKHGVSSAERVTIFKNFRNLLYATTEDSFEAKLEEFFQLKSLQRNKIAMSYFGDLVEEKECWAKAYRRKDILRGSNTNNYVEAQFLVLKDTLLKRQRQFNIVMLLDVLFYDLEEHYKLRLLSVADGSFDGIYSKRFYGAHLKVPTEDERKFFRTKLEDLGSNLFRVPSRSSSDTMYLVDMSLGSCECFVGFDGSPCIHQFFLWTENNMDTVNFLPIFNKEERQKYAQIALGKSLSISYYESLHDVVPSKSPVTNYVSNDDISSQTIVQEADDYMCSSK